MEYGTPEEVAKEFPGLYKAEELTEMSDTGDYEEEKDKKKKDKKDSKKDKGYAALDGESSHDEEDVVDSNSKSPGKKKLKGFKLSMKKDKTDKDKEKESKKLEKEKEKKVEKLKRRSDSSDRKSVERDTPFSSVRIPFSAERHRDINAHRSSVPAAFFTSTPKSSKEKEPTENEKSSTVSAFNAFLNAPAPLFLAKKKDKEKDPKKEKKEKETKVKESKKEKKDKDSKEKKDHPSGVAKVKLKLMRSKNSLEDPHEKGDLHVSVSHQFPEDPDALAKEIKKYEHLLEQTHVQIKGSKKISKKQEETLWEYQRTLTQLKRKLRSINALSTASANISFHHGSIPKDGFDAGVATTCTIQTNTIPPPPGAMKMNDEVVQTNKSLSVTHAHTDDFATTTEINEATPKVELDVELPSTSPTKTSDILVQSSSDCLENIPSALIVQNNVSEESPLKNTNSCAAVSEKTEAENLTCETMNEIPVRKSARRTLDFSGIVVEKKNASEDIISSSELAEIPASTSQDFQTAMNKVESPLERERDKVEVRVLVHNESRDEDDISSVGTVDDANEALPSISSRNEENIGIVVADANAMIGSMHEELEAAAIVFGQRKLSRDEATNQFSQKSTSYLGKISKSEPTFVDQVHDSSDIELIRDDDDGAESFTDDLIPEVLNLPIFETPEYLIYENEQLALFNLQLQDDIAKEETELNILMDELNSFPVADLNESVRPDSSEASDIERLIIEWKTVKCENEELHDNVERLRAMVAVSRLEEFKLDARLRFLEDKLLPVSPITTTTPLHSET